MSVCVCVCVRACVLACVHDMFAIYGNNILPRLIMIIIKIIFLYFTEIAHTDDFTLNEYPASRYNQDRLNECSSVHFSVIFGMFLTLQRALPLN